MFQDRPSHSWSCSNEKDAILEQKKAIRSEIMIAKTEYNRKVENAKMELQEKIECIQQGMKKKAG